MPSRYIRAYERNANTQYHSPDEPHRLIVFGPGSLQKWYIGRRSFDRLAGAIYQDVILGNQDDADPGVSVHWLGYYKPESPYGIDETVFNSIDVLATSIKRLTLRYRSPAVIDLVCHSLMGTVALYGAIKAIYDTSRVRSIITINSPLKGSNDYIDAYREDFGPDKQPFMNRLEEPQVFLDLQEISEVMNTIQRCSLSPVPTLITCSTEGDEIVPLETSATVKFATRTHKVTKQDLEQEGMKLRHPHTDVLVTTKLIRFVVDELLHKFDI